MVSRKHLCQYDADDNCRIYLADGERVLSNTYGAGIAYPQRRCDGMVLPVKFYSPTYRFYKYPKVDSFDLYRNTVGDLILRDVLRKGAKRSQSAASSSQQTPAW